MGIKVQVIQWVRQQRAEKLRRVDLSRPDSPRCVRRSETRFRGNFFFPRRCAWIYRAPPERARTFGCVEKERRKLLLRTRSWLRVFTLSWSTAQLPSVFAESAGGAGGGGGGEVDKRHLNGGGQCSRGGGGHHAAGREECGAFFPWPKGRKIKRKLSAMKKRCFKTRTVSTSGQLRAVASTRRRL